MNAGGNWSDTSRWLGGTVADGTDNTAHFVFGLSALTTVTLDTNRTIGHMVFEDTLGGNNYFQVSPAAAQTLSLAVTSGSPILTANAIGGIINSVITGSQGFQKLGSGELRLSGSNTALNGDIDIDAGTLRVDTTNAINTSSATGTVTVNANGRIVLGSGSMSRSITFDGGTMDFSASMNTGSGQVFIIQSGGAKFTNAYLASNPSIGIGQAFTVGPYLSGSGDIEFTTLGAGKFFGMWGVNSGYTGTWIIKNAPGYVAIREMNSGAPSGIGNGSVMVESGGTLAYDAGTAGAGTDVGGINWTAFHDIAGSGTVRVEAGTTTAFALTYQGVTITPGTSTAAGILTFQGKLNLDGGSTLTLNLDGATPGTGFDQLVVSSSAASGNLAFTNVSLATTIGYVYANSDKLAIVDNQGNNNPIGGAGNFNGLPDDSTVYLGTFDYAHHYAKITYDGIASSLALDGGNDVILYDFTMVLIPEPASLALMLSALPLLLWRKKIA